MPKQINIAEIQVKTWLTEEEAARYAGMSARQIRSLRLEGTQVGTLPYSRISANVRIKRTELDKFFEQHAVKSA